MPPGPLLEIEELTFRYRRASEPAIRGVSLAVDPGEVVLLAGPSGCGKSTLIRAMNGLIPHAYRGELRGAVRIAGRASVEMRLREISLLVGTVLQDPAKQILGATVEAELAFGPENLGVGRHEILARIGRVVRQTDLESLAGRETANLSGGERQLLAVAGILMMEPRLYVVDEPLANLDPATARRLLGLLRRLADEGHAVVIVEHRVEEALELKPDRVLYLDEGSTRYLGPVEGFLAIADPAAVKLPFEVVLARERELGERGGDPDLEPLPRRRPFGSPRLAMDDVHVRLGRREVLRGITTRLGSTEVVAVLGPNGSGKTTLFRTAMRLLEPHAGSVAVNDRPATTYTVADLARVFGYVFQSPSQMLFARTVREEILFGPRNLGLAGDDPEVLVNEVLRRTALDSLENIAERPPLTLSFGQQKRLALAIGLALRPPTLVLDEPSAGQDHRTAAEFLASVQAIPDLESLYLVTHDVDLALTHADRILVIREGRVVADGPPEHVIEDEEQWRASNLHRTTLMTANLAWRGVTGGFLDAHALARWVIASEGGERKVAGDGGSSVGPGLGHRS